MNAAYLQRKVKTALQIRYSIATEMDNFSALYSKKNLYGLMAPYVDNSLASPLSAAT